MNAIPDTAPRRQERGPAHRSAWARLGVAAACVLFIVVIAAMAASDVVRGYRAVLAETQRDLDTHARIIAEQTARSIQAVDVVMTHMAQRLYRGDLAALDDASLHDLLRGQAVGLVQTDGLVVHDAQGVARATSWVHPPPEAANITDRSFFHEVRDGQVAGLYVGTALRSRIDGQWFFPIGRRIGGDNGDFVGTVGARGRIDYFQRFYGDALPEAGTQISLVHRDGTLVARFPVVEDSLGKHFPMFEALLASEAVGQHRAVLAASPVDGVERFGAARMVPDYPLAVIVARDSQAALAPWREQAIGTATRTAALAALATLLLWLLLRQLARVSAARDSLEMTRQRFALAVAGSDDGIWDWDQISGQVFASQRARELLGLPAGPELLHRDDWFAAVRFHPDDTGRRDTALAVHLAGRTPAFEGEYRVRHPDGSYRWIHVRGLCVRDAQGRALRIAGSISDIDARKQAEEALRRSEERYAIAMIGLNVGHWVWDVTSDEVFASSNLAGLIGLPPDEPMPTTAAAFMAAVPLHPDDSGALHRAAEAHLAGRTPRIDVEYRVLHRESGEYRWMHTRGQCFRDAQGKPRRVAGATLEVSERKRTEEALRRSEQALRESEERYQLAVDGANEGLWDWDLPTDMLFLSPRAQEILWRKAEGESRRPRREWIGLTDYHPDDVPRVRAAISAHLHGTTRLFDTEYRLRHHDGSWHWYRQRGIALYDATGRAYRMAGSMEDVSDRKNAEADRDRLEGQLRQAQKLEAMGTLAGGIAHDFNNILAAILGYGDMAQREAAEGTALRRHIDATISAGMRAKSLVERILAFSRSGMGERVPVHVQSVVIEALDQIAASLPSTLRMERSLRGGDAGVLGDPTQIHQVVMNLCANAAQAMRSAGLLSVELDSVELTEPLCVSTSQLRAGAYVRLRVRDTGVGIEPRVLERIFDPFFTTRDIGVGTGLGLSLVHGIVTDLGGGIDVDSRIGEGTTMSVYLPQQAFVAASVAVEEPVASGAGETVLLVDDEEALVRLGEEMLAQLGYEPVGHASSVAALAAFREDPLRFDLVLTDEAMPAMTGSELVHEIRAVRPDMPILLMSGYVSPALAARARELGVIEVLSKPLAARDMARSLAAALHRASVDTPH
ncbi:MAG TPA: PAS domain-containing protein [Burkholderiaceae bacterium]|nr:PAS domain-containing protein [Burkholderiaceae bacterium]